MCLQKRGHMALSSNSIIHFTKSIDNLKGILENNFKLNFCEEIIKVQDRTVGIMIPMICFCDIPLSEVKIHITKYGRYGIGLIKSWAQKMGLNPVLYVEQSSNLSRSLSSSYKEFISKKKIDFSTWAENEKNILDIFRYMKNYQSDLRSNGRIEKNYRFSDEREWRYVPDITSESPIAVPSKFYKKKLNEEYINELQNQIKEIRLEFTPNDIKYIIIENEDEISPIVTILREAKGKLYSYNDVERLTTRILTTEQIETDF